MPVRHSLQLETLENRRLMAVDILADIEVDGDARFIPRDIVGYNGSVYMRLSDNITGPEPWVSEGTPESTRLLKDIRVGDFGSGARDFAEYNGQLFFTANNGFSGLELWVTQGTKATTQLIADIWPGSENGAPTEFTVFNGLLYFFANDGSTGRELYRSDGTNVGTYAVGDSVPGRRGSSGTDLMQIGDRMFFRSESTAPEQAGIWVSDGTGEGTVQVSIPGIAAQDIQLLTQHGNQLVFASAEKLWVTDGTEAGSREITPTGDQLGTSFSSIASVGNTLYVTDDLGLHAITADLSVAQTVTPLAENVVGSAGKAYYWNAGGFYVISGAADPTQLLPFNPQFGTTLGATEIVSGGLLFAVHRVLDRWEIWVSDGTPTGTTLLERVTDSSAEPFVEFQQIDDRVYFAATNGNFHQSIWAIPAPVIEPPEDILGDFNGDEEVNDQDIDILFAAIGAQSSDLQFDLDEDGSVATSDVDVLVHDILKTRRGDLNLDGEVNFADFLELSGSFGKSSATWADGDTDGDGNVAFADFLTLSGNFGFVSTDAEENLFV